MDTTRKQRIITKYLKKTVYTILYLGALYTVYLPFFIAELLYNPINRLIEWMDTSPWFEGYAELGRYLRERSLFANKDEEVN